jgi:Putative MetA-pathway of phenol degradation
MRILLTAACWLAASVLCGGLAADDWLLGRPFADGLEAPWIVRGQDSEVMEAFEDDDDEFDIADPGPDFGDFPNSAFTLPKGRMYLEQAPFTYQTQNAQNPAAYSWPFMLRYGLTDDVEFRLLTGGLTSVSGADRTTGFAPLLFDLKVHLWDDQMACLLPAASLEVYVQTTWGSRALSGGTQPSLNLNLDFPLSECLNIEMTFGYTGVRTANNEVMGTQFIPPAIRRGNLNDNQFAYQWAIERQVTERLQLFLHGYYNGPVFLQGGSSVVIGGGFFYQLSSRWMIFNSYNAGLDSDAPPFGTQLGVALAF